MNGKSSSGYVVYIKGIFLAAVILISGLFLAQAGIERVAPETAGGLFSYDRAGTVVTLGLCGREYQTDTGPSLEIARGIWYRGAAYISRLSIR